MSDLDNRFSHHAEYRDSEGKVTVDVEGSLSKDESSIELAISYTRDNDECKLLWKFSEEGVGEPWHLVGDPLAGFAVCMCVKLGPRVYETAKDCYVHSRVEERTNWRQFFFCIKHKAPELGVAAFHSGLRCGLGAPPW